MARVRLTADVEPELRRQVKIAAASSDKSVSQWVEDTIRREIEHTTGSNGHGNCGTTVPPGTAPPEDEIQPIKLRGGGTLNLEDREELVRKYPDMHLAPPGVKPKGLNDPPRLREGSGTVADAVIEDRR